MELIEPTIIHIEKGSHLPIIHIGLFQVPITGNKGNLLCDT